MINFDFENIVFSTSHNTLFELSKTLLNEDLTQMMKDLYSNSSLSSRIDVESRYQYLIYHWYYVHLPKGNIILK